MFDEICIEGRTNIIPADRKLMMHIGEASGQAGALNAFLLVESWLLRTE